MKIIDHFIKYTDEFGLIQPEPQKTSQNGLHFTALAIISLHEHGFLKELSTLFLKAYRRCEKRDSKGLPTGIFHRCPTNFEQNSIDDMMGVAVASAYLDKTIGIRVLKHWRQSGGVFVNSSLTEKAYFGRFPALYATFQFSVGEKPTLLNELYWFGSIIFAALQPAKDQDGWRMSFMMIKVSNSQTLLSTLAKAIWRYRAKKVLKHGIGGNLSEYWRGDMDHPLVQNLWDIY